MPTNSNRQTQETHNAPRVIIHEAHTCPVSRVTKSDNVLQLPSVLLQDGIPPERIKTLLNEQLFLDRKFMYRCQVGMEAQELVALNTIYQGDKLGLKALLCHEARIGYSLLLLACQTNKTFALVKDLFTQEEWQVLINQQLATHALLFNTSDFEVLTWLLAFYPQAPLEAALQATNALGDTLLSEFSEQPQAIKALLARVPTSEHDKVILMENTLGNRVLENAISTNTESFLLLFHALSTEKQREVVCTRTHSGLNLLQPLALCCPEGCEAVLACLMTQLPPVQRLDFIRTPSYFSYSALQNAIKLLLKARTSEEEARAFSFLKALLSYLTPHEVVQALVTRAMDIERERLITLLKAKPAFYQEVVSLVYGEERLIEECCVCH